MGITSINDGEMNGKILNEDKYQKTKQKLKKVGKILLITGGIFLVIGLILLIMGFFSSTQMISDFESGPENAAGSVSKFAIGGFLFAVGFAFAMIGIVVLLVAHNRDISSFAASSTMPVVKEVTEYTADNIAPSIGKGLGHVTSGVATGIAKGIAATKNATKSTCSTCGSVLNDDEQFCSNCGAKIDKSKTCPQCGASLKTNAKFCSNCGTKL